MGTIVAKIEITSPVPEGEEVSDELLSDYRERLEAYIQDEIESDSVVEVKVSHVK